MGALHANGAMIRRSRSHETYQRELNFPFSTIEAFRERMFPHPLLYVPKPLAIFSRTLQTARSESRAEWAAVQTILRRPLSNMQIMMSHTLADMFIEARAKHPPNTSILILAALLQPGCRGLLGHSVLKDWLLLLRGVLWRPRVFLSVLRSRRLYPDWWRLLEQQTAERFKERRSHQDYVCDDGSPEVARVKSVP